MRLSKMPFGHMDGEQVRREPSKVKVMLTRSSASHVCTAKVTLKWQAQKDVGKKGWLNSAEDPRSIKTLLFV